MRVKVSVKQADIRIGMPNSTRLCPVALATNRALTNAAGRDIVTSVGWSHMCIYTLGEIIPVHVFYPRSVTLKALEKFISRFDAGRKVKPFSFWLEV